MEIEKLIEKLRDAGWTNPGLTDKQSLEWDAATALEQLQAENDRLKRERNEAVIDMTALAAGHCCDLCAVEYCIVRGNTGMCTAFKWRGPKGE